MTFTQATRMDAVGTSYQGLLKIKYPELCAIFGQPEGPSMDGKVQVQWTIKIAGSVIATIYDYKENQSPRDLLVFHIGGKTKDVVQLVELIVKEYRKAHKDVSRN